MCSLKILFICYLIQIDIRIEACWEHLMLKKAFLVFIKIYKYKPMSCSVQRLSVWFYVVMVCLSF